MSNFGTDKQRVKTVAKYLGVTPPVELDTMLQRHAAARRVALEVTLPDITGLPIDKVAAAVNKAGVGSEESINRARAIAMQQCEAAYHGLAIDFLRSQLPAVAQRFNDAAKEFVSQYDPAILEGTTEADADPRALTTDALVIYGRSKDAYSALESALKVAYDIVPEAHGASRRMALTVDGAPNDVRDLRSVMSKSSSALFGHYGTVVRVNNRPALEANPRETYRAFTPGPLKIHMPESYDDYLARLALYSSVD